MTIGDLRLGSIDGKFEFVEGSYGEGLSPFDAFLIPKNVDPDRFSGYDKYFVYGFRGTGKTSLLRWLAHRRTAEGGLSAFVLFKSDVTEVDRRDLSMHIGFELQEVDSGRMEVSQDFKLAWSWFVYHKIAETLKDHPIISASVIYQKLARLCGISSAPYKKILGSRLVQSQNATAAARLTAERKFLASLS